MDEPVRFYTQGLGIKEIPPELPLRRVGDDMLAALRGAHMLLILLLLHKVISR